MDKICPNASLGSFFHNVDAGEGTFESPLGELHDMKYDGPILSVASNVDY